MPMMGAMYQGPQNWSDRLAIIGAALKDASPNSNGGNLSAAQQMLMQRQMAQYQMGMMGRMSGLIKPAQAAQYQDEAASSISPVPSISTPSLSGIDASLASGAPSGGLDGPLASIADAQANAAPAPSPAPAVTSPPRPRVQTAPARAGGLDLRDPETQQTLTALSGINPEYAKSMIELGKAVMPTFESARPGTMARDTHTGAVIGSPVPNPQYINGLLSDPTKVGATPYIPQLEKGQIPLFDAAHNVVGVRNLDGTVGAAAATAGAVADATQAAAAKYDLVTPDLAAGGKGPPTSRLSLLPNSSGPGPNVPRIGQPAPAPSTAAPVLGTPSPQDTAYRNVTAEAAAKRYTALQDAASSAPGAISRIKAMSDLLKGVNGGALAPEMYDVASGLNSLGIKVDPKLRNKDAAAVLERSMASEAMKNPDTGANMFPRVTNFEYGNALKQVPGLLQSEKGRDVVVAMKTAEQNRIMDINRNAYQWNQKYGRLDAPDAQGRSFQDRLQTWSTKHPLYAGIPGLDHNAKTK